jgi:hypothetical protein
MLFLHIFRGIIAYYFIAVNRICTVINKNTNLIFNFATLSQLAILRGLLVILSGLSLKKRDWVFPIFLFFFFYNCAANYNSDILMRLFLSKRPGEIVFAGVENVPLYIRASTTQTWVFTIILVITGIALCVPRISVIKYRTIKRSGQKPPELLVNQAKTQFVVI